jgi:thioredoxin 1
MSQAIDLDTLKQKLDQGKDLFLKVWQKGCGPCKLSEPALERLEPTYGSTLEFVQVCIDDHPDIADIANIEALPAFFIFKEKKMKAKSFGFKGIAKLEAFIKES